MSLFAIAWKSIRQRALASSLTGLSVALGVMLMVSVLVIHGIVDRVFSQRSIGYDLIIGPKGSDLQLALKTVYRIGRSQEPLPYLYYQELAKNPLVSEAVPFAYGDYTQEGGFPIVGTTGRYFELPYAPRRNFRIQKGGHKLTNPFDAIIGAQVAQQNNWKVGSEFQMVHGGTAAESDHVHDEKFTVVAVLAPTATPNDKTVFIGIEGFYQVSGHEKPIRESVQRWLEFNGQDADDEAIARTIKEMDLSEADSHAGHDHGGHDHGGHDHGSHDVPDIQKEVSSILVLTRRPPGKPLTYPSIAAPQLRAALNESFQVQAINPMEPIRTLMENVVGNIRTVLLIMTALIIVVSGIGIFVSIYNSMADRRREIAIMRALGASRVAVFSIILAESTMLCVLGGLLGVVLGHGLVFLSAPYVEARTGLLVDPFAFEQIELVLIPGLILLASLIGFVPGLTAYRTDVSKALSP